MKNLSLFPTPCFAALVMLFCLQSACGQKFADIQPAPQSDWDALAGYHLTLARIDQLQLANKAIFARAKKDPVIRSEYKSCEGLLKKDLAEATAFFRDQVPHLAVTIQESGMTTRDFYLASMSIFYAALAEVIQSPSVDSIPDPALRFAKALTTMVPKEKESPGASLPPYIPAENVVFLRQNHERISEFEASLRQGSAALDAAFPK